MAESSNKRRNPAADLTEDLIVEILSRLPVKSLCRFKCVSRHWRALCSDPRHRKKLPQTLSGFFYGSKSDERFPKDARHFTNAWGRGPPLIYPSFSFLPECEHIVLLDCCNGLLLCRCWENSSLDSFHYVVCNPAIEKWVALPDSGWGGRLWTARLGFDPAVSYHFHVFEFIENDGWFVTGVDIYSSVTGVWSHKESGWRADTSLVHDLASIFFNGMLHLVIHESAIVAVDGEGKTWRTIPMPQIVDDDIIVDSESGFIGLSQGRLYYMNAYDNNPLKLSIWVLEDYDTEEWILKRRVNTSKLFGKTSCRFGLGYHVITIHPECNLIFFVVGWDKTLVAYETDRKEVCVIRILGSDCEMPYLPYVPFYSESLADGN